MKDLQKKKQANFLLSVSLLQSLKNQIPVRKQSEFVEQALEKALKRELLLKLLDNPTKIWAERRGKNFSEKFIRSLREAKRP